MQYLFGCEAVAWQPGRKLGRLGKQAKLQSVNLANIDYLLSIRPTEKVSFFNDWLLSAINMGE